MITYYDKTGKEITEQEWELLFTEYGYEQVRRSILAAKKRRFVVSTVWLGKSNNGGKSGIFQTRVLTFDNKTRIMEEPEYQGSYDSQINAGKGHEKIVDRIVKDKEAKYV
jgi:hypothetical protein